MKHLVEGMAVVLLLGVCVVLYAELQRRLPMPDKHTVEVEQVEDKQPPMYIMQPVRSK
jgi:hypothetical protein